MRHVLAVLAFLCAATSHAANYSDIWWNPAESGWGLTIADHETNLWAVWYTYKADGSPTWMFASGGTFDASRTRFTGSLYQATGPAYNAPFSSRPVNVTQAGTITIDFAPPGLANGIALFSYTVGSVSGTRQVERFGFGNDAAAWGSDATDIWFDPAESGWGIALSQHGGTLFGVWYTYDEAGQPLFVFLPAGAAGSAGQFSGDVFTARGNWFGATSYDPNLVKVQPFGTVQLSVTSLPAVQGFVPRRGDWNTRLANGTTIDKFFTQLGFGNAAPSVAEPACLITSTCVTRDAPAAGASSCSYRTCTAAYSSMDAYGYYNMNTPCTCGTDAASNVACQASRPQVADGMTCGGGQGCAVGSVCADLRNGMPPVCMAYATFQNDHCGY